MTKRAYIIHGWDGQPDEGWQRWLRIELEKKSFQVFALEMPETSRPEIGAWVNKLREAVGKPDEETYFVGHSIGCQTIMRYLSTIDQKVGGAVYVAGWFDLIGLETKEEKEIAWPWIETPIDFEKIKNNCPNATAILSDNDPFVELEPNKEIFEGKLGAEVIVQRGKGHFISEEKMPIVLEKF